MKKIAITTSTFAEFDKRPLELCRKQGFNVIVNPYNRQVTANELLRLSKGAVGLIAGTELITSCILSKLDSLKVISRCGVGLENIDLIAAKEKGIRVFNTADIPTAPVAELTVGLIISLIRNVRQMDSSIRSGIWKKYMGNLLSGKNVGVIGFGRIGRKVAELLKPFGCRLAYTDPVVSDGLLGLRRLPLEELLGWADIISIHASTKNRILGKREFRLMKRGAWLINVSRGGTLDEEVLYNYLKNKYLSGAAMDVYEQEPYNGPLKEMNNIILTPHIGSYAKEARIEMEMLAVKNLLEGMESIMGERK